ncbi:uncharacterized protein C16orf71 homolog isoform X2 [Tupaia chinensis]|uniref:uncharacterized protein C16orf71 homolog isoform X2 n=1 Tax=Tupaia chinensis TaxID=246437 RepID=UPI0003C90934|nr:uncharacterized protein C16orf71 homolog isoform X2 [Tupaia chinensis]
MAAEDKDVSAPWASQPGWDAILEAVRDQLPSIDSDSSLSDCGEEEPFIFQRSQTLLIPDLSEELAEDPASGNDLGTWVTEAEGIPPEDLVPVGVVSEPGGRRTARTEDSASRGERDPSQLEGCGEVGSFLRVSDEIPRCMVPAGDPESVSFNTKRPQASPWGLQGEATLPYQEEDLKTKPLGATSRDPERLRALRRERRRMIEKDILQKVTWEAREPACGDQAVESDPRPEAPPKEPRDAGPVLSLQQLEDWDLDYLLQSLAAREENQGNRALRATRWAADRSQGGDRTVPSAQDELMERLALLCATQSRAVASVQKVPTDTPQDAEEQEARSRCASVKPDFWAEQGSQLKGREPPTIFIDLRQTEPSDHQASESFSPRPSSSDSEEEEEEEEPVALGDQQGPGEQPPHGSQRRRDCTGKSQLLQQLRAFRKGLAQPGLPASRGPGSQKDQASADAAGPGISGLRGSVCSSDSQEQVPEPRALLGQGRPGPQPLLWANRRYLR